MQLPQEKQRELSQNLGKENQEEAAPKKRKVNTSIQKAKHLPKTPSRKSNKKRKLLVATQNVDFELGSPAPGLPPPPSAKTHVTLIRKVSLKERQKILSLSKHLQPLNCHHHLCKGLTPKADLDVSLSSDSSEELLPQDTMDKVGYASNSSMCRWFSMCAV